MYVAGDDERALNRLMVLSQVADLARPLANLDALQPAAAGNTE